MYQKSKIYKKNENYRDQVGKRSEKQFSRRKLNHFLFCKYHLQFDPISENNTNHYTALSLSLSLAHSLCIYVSIYLSFSLFLFLSLSLYLSLIFISTSIVGKDRKVNLGGAPLFKKKGETFFIIS